MTPFVDDGDMRLYVGDCLDVLRQLPDESVDCCVTSPPYWGLRDYGAEGQLGLEPTPDEYVQNMVAVFREVRRVLAPHGTCWVNLGDSYAAQGGGKEAGVYEGKRVAEADWQPPRSAPAGLKPKDLVGIPWRVAFALQADGWWLRSDIVWSKPNPMPESVTDRPTKAHEYLFLLSKQPRYWFDQEAVREKEETWDGQSQSAPAAGGHGSGATLTGSLTETASHTAATAGKRTPARRSPLIPEQTKHGVGTQGIGSKTFGHWAPNGRNVRSVWEIATQPFPGAHFATFPEELARRCIVAGCPAEVCRTCGKPRERIVERDRIVSPPAQPHAYMRASSAVAGCRDVNFSSNGGGHTHVTTLGWSDCGHNAYRPGRVLDPFAGAGTVGLVARKHARHSVLIELSGQYAREILLPRLSQLSLLAEIV